MPPPLFSGKRSAPGRPSCPCTRPCAPPWGAARRPRPAATHSRRSQPAGGTAAPRVPSAQLLPQPRCLHTPRPAQGSPRGPSDVLPNLRAHAGSPPFFLSVGCRDCKGLPVPESPPRDPTENMSEVTRVTPKPGARAAFHVGKEQPFHGETPQRRGRGLGRPAGLQRGRRVLTSFSRGSPPELLGGREGAAACVRVRVAA